MDQETRPRRRTVRETPQEEDANRGVSEVVSFIITFSIITMMVGVLYTAGFMSMNQLQTGNQMQNAEGVLIAMSDSFGELQEGQAPKRAGSLDLDVGASIVVSNASGIDVVVNEEAGPKSLSLRTRSFDYRLDERAVTYETGAVFRSNQDGSAMVREPSGIFCSNESSTSMVSVVTLTSGGSGSVASGTATITGVQRLSTLHYPDDETSSVKNVTINVSSPHRPAWNQYLHKAGWEEDGDEFVCEDLDQAYVRQTIVEVQLAA